mgnify:FL=1
MGLYDDRQLYRFRIPYDEIFELVLQIRSELFNKYDLYDIGGKYSSFRGLCDIATKVFVERIQRIAAIYDINIDTYIVHGEQKHSLEIYPPYWVCQHTWCELYDGLNTLYVDITSQQFQWLYQDIPDFYISNRPPRWYLPDRDNRYFKIMRKNYRLAELYDLFTKLKASFYMILWEMRH